VFGANGANISAATDEKGGVPMLFFPDASDAKPLVSDLDLAAAIQNVMVHLEEVERRLPELALTQIRRQEHLTAPGVRAGWSDAIGKIVEARGNYDDGLIRAQMMAITMGGIGQYENFEPFGPDDYARGNLEHYVAERPVIKDSLAKQEKITALQTVKDLPPALARLVLQELDYADEVIEAVLSELAEAQAQAVAAAVRGFAQGVFGENGAADEAEEERVDVEA
jgi:hypothetical protein